MRLHRTRGEMGSTQKRLLKCIYIYSQVTPGSIQSPLKSVGAVPLTSMDFGAGPLSLMLSIPQGVSEAPASLGVEGPLCFTGTLHFRPPLLYHKTGQCPWCMLGILEAGLRKSSEPPLYKNTPLSPGQELVSPAACGYSWFSLTKSPCFHILPA